MLLAMLELMETQHSAPNGADGIFGARSSINILSLRGWDEETNRTS